MRKLVLIIIASTIAIGPTCSISGTYTAIEEIRVPGIGTVQDESEIDCSLFDCTDPQIIVIER